MLVGLSIFHVLLTCFSLPNSLLRERVGGARKRGRGGGKKKENIGLVLRFFTFAVCPF